MIDPALLEDSDLSTVSRINEADFDEGSITFSESGEQVNDADHDGLDNYMDRTAVDEAYGDMVLGKPLQSLLSLLAQEYQPQTTTLLYCRSTVALLRLLAMTHGHRRYRRLRRKSGVSVLATTMPTIKT